MYCCTTLADGIMRYILYSFDFVSFNDTFRVNVKKKKFIELKIVNHTYTIPYV